MAQGCGIIRAVDDLDQRTPAQVARCGGAPAKVGAGVATRLRRAERIAGLEPLVVGVAEAQRLGVAHAVAIAVLVVVGRPLSGDSGITGIGDKRNGTPVGTFR